tara:strand:+ start:142 stop:972 length:831 start_codon:yes stop_codon:yes gene_type:complete
MADDEEQGTFPGPVSIDIPMSAPESSADAATNVSPQIVGVTQPMLTGNVQMNQQVLPMADASNYKFVMGPNGEMIALQKAKFDLKHFAYGTIPLVVIFLSLFALNFAGISDDWEVEDYQFTLTKIENSTAYSGEGTVPDNSDRVFLSCDFGTDKQTTEAYNGNLGIYCTNDNIIMLQNDSGDKEIGAFYNNNGTIYFDAGIDYGVDEVYTSVRAQNDLSDSGFEDLYYIICCLALLSIIVLIPVGFSTGRPGLGYGALFSLVGLPFALVFIAFLAW